MRKTTVGIFSGISFIMGIAIIIRGKDCYTELAINLGLNLPGRRWREGVRT